MRWGEVYVQPSPGQWVMAWQVETVVQLAQKKG